jgi:hypothetical protein
VQQLWSTTQAIEKTWSGILFQFRVVSHTRRAKKGTNQKTSQEVTFLKNVSMKFKVSASSGIGLEE